MSISLYDWKTAGGTKLIQNRNLFAEKFISLINQANAAGYNDKMYAQSMSNYIAKKYVSQGNYRVPVRNTQTLYGGGVVGYDTRESTGQRDSRFKFGNLGTNEIYNINYGAYCMDYMPRVYVKLTKLSDYLIKLRDANTEDAPVWVYTGDGIFIPSGEGVQFGFRYNVTDYTSFIAQAGDYYVCEQLQFYTDKSDGTTQDLIDSANISYGSSAGYNCEVDVFQPMYIYPWNDNEYYFYAMGYYSLFMAQRGLMYGFDMYPSIYDTIGLHAALITGIDLLSPLYNPGYTPSTSNGWTQVPQAPSGAVHYATKEVWETLLNGGGCAWSYDLDVVTSPSGKGLNVPTTPGQPENPVVTDEGTGDNISDKVLYPSPAYIPNATVYDRYFLTPNQMPDIKKFLFSDTFVDNIKRLWTNPAEYVISLVCYPFDVDSTGLTTTSGVVSVGGVSSDIAAAALTDRGVPYFYGGSVMVDNYYNSYLDFEPYTSIDIYIPYIGVRPLNVSQVVGHTLCIGYYIDLNTQQITALIGLDGQGGNLGQVVTQFVGSIGIQTPLSGTSAQDMIRNIVAQTSGLITGVGAIAGGIMGANPALLASGVASTSNALLGGGHTAPSYYGSLSPVSGLYTPQVAYLIINRPRQAMPAAYLTQQGFSSNYSGKVSQFSGYLECASVNISSTNTMTEQEQQEIINLLTGGIYCG